MNRRKIDVIMSSLLIIAATIVLISDNLVEGGAETELGTMFLPRIVASLMIIFAGSVGIQALLKLLKRSELESSEIINTEGFLGVFIYIGIFVAYWLAVPYVGFLVATPFVMFSIAWLLGGRKLLPIALLSTITPVLIFYASLHFLRVFLPTWTLS